MKKLLFISDESPFSFDHSGASSFKTSHLKILSVLEDLCIYVVSLPGHEENVMKRISGLQNVTFLKADFERIEPLSLYTSVWKFVLAPDRLSQDSLFFSAVHSKNVLILQRIIDDLGPDIIWAEHVESFLLSGYLRYNGKIIYSHHDFLWKLVLIRRQKVKDYLRSFFYRVIQKRALKKSGKYVIGGATHELAQITKINPGAITFYIPTLYPKISLHFSVNPVLDTPFRIVHFGSPKATASRIGLKNLLLYILPLLQKEIDFECWVIGETDHTDAELNKLLNKPYIIRKGYTGDLGTVLRPFDIHILSYNESTGSRTRYPLALNYAQVLVAHEAGVTGMRGLVHNENSIIERSFDGMVRSVIRLFREPEERIRLALNAKKWYDQTHQNDLYAALLNEWFTDNAII